MKIKRLLAFALAGALCLSETVAYAAVDPEQESNTADTEYQSDTGIVPGATEEVLPVPVRDTGDSTATMSNARPEQEEEGSYGIATASNAMFMAITKIIKITLKEVKLFPPDGNSTTVDLGSYFKKLSDEEQPTIKVGEMDAETVKKYYDTAPSVNGTELSFTLKKAIQSVTLTIPLELTNENCTYTDMDGKPLALTVKVTGVDSISLNYTTRKMGVGETFLFQTNEVIPAEEIAWSSSAPEYVTVNKKGEAEAIKTGTAVVTAEWRGFKAACTVTVSRSSSTPSISDGETNNVGKQDYTNTRWAQPVKSYLMDNKNGTFTRVEYDSDQVLVETYRSDETVIDRKAIEMELPLFGGFYGGEKYNFLVFGQSNPKEDDSQEVIRVVRYTKNWERAGAARLLGANTLRPFEAGSLRMTEYGNRLYLRTAHTMYTSESDGLNHQANLTALINTETMWITDSYYDVMNTGYGYVSHSFNQFIALDGDTLIAADHGDAYPRAVVLFRYGQKAGGDGFMSGEIDHINVLPIKGQTGDNSTGASVGGLTVTGTSYLIAGNSIDQEDENSKVNGVRNIFVTSTDKEEFSAESTKLHWITEFKGSEKVSTPQMVKINDDKVLLLYTVNSRLNYVYLNGRGEKASPIYEAYGKLSDCQPVMMGDQAVWYYTEKSEPQFCRLGGKLEKITLNAGSTKTMQPGETFQFMLNEVVPINEVRWSSSKDEVVSVSNNGLIETYENGTSVITASWNGLEVSCKITVRRPSSSGSSGGGGGFSSGGGGGGGGGVVRPSSGGVGGLIGSSAPAGLPGYVVQGAWTQIGDVWFFSDASGLPYVNCWAAVYNPYANTALGQSNYDWFWFDASGKMMTGWHLDADGNYYYLNEASDGTRGRMVTGWFWIKDADGVQRCYYFDPVADTGTRGKMMKNTVVDGYQIDANGHWVVNGVVQTK